MKGYIVLRDGHEIQIAYDEWHEDINAILREACELYGVNFPLDISDVRIGEAAERPKQQPEPENPKVHVDESDEDTPEPIQEN